MIVPYYLFTFHAYNRLNQTLKPIQQGSSSSPKKWPLLRYIQVKSSAFLLRLILWIRRLGKSNYSIRLVQSMVEIKRWICIVIVIMVSSWIFKTMNYDIAFSIWYNDEEEVFPTYRVESHRQVEEGSLICKKIGKCKFFLRLNVQGCE